MLEIPGKYHELKGPANDIPARQWQRLHETYHRLRVSRKKRSTLTGTYSNRVRHRIFVGYVTEAQVQSLRPRVHVRGVRSDVEPSVRDQRRRVEQEAYWVGRASGRAVRIGRRLRRGAVRARSEGAEGVEVDRGERQGDEIAVECNVWVDCELFTVRPCLPERRSVARDIHMRADSGQPTVLYVCT